MPGSELDAETAALLKRVADDRERRCAELRAATASQIRQIVRAARAEGRTSRRNAITHERAHIELGVRQAQARADIEAHRQEQRKSQELLAAMWRAITAALERRWREPALRQRWIDAALGQAVALLSGRAWLIESAWQWSERERNELTNRAHQRGAGTVAWSLNPAMPAGLRIRTSGACLDATVPALLVQRAAIEAAFLAEYLPSLVTEQASELQYLSTAASPAAEPRADG